LVRRIARSRHGRRRSARLPGPRAHPRPQQRPGRDLRRRSRRDRTVADGRLDPARAGANGVNRDELLRALASYPPSDPREAESLPWMGRLLAAPEDPFARENPEGHITASAIVARPDGSEFLLLYHPKLGRWLQPGGHTEHSDPSAFDAALREAREETGIGD